MFIRVVIAAVIATFYGNSLHVSSCLAIDQQIQAPSNSQNDVGAKQTSDRDATSVTNAAPTFGLPDDWKDNIDVPESVFVNYCLVWSILTAKNSVGN